MRTVGQILREERERKYYTLEEVEKATKIRKELLEALEEERWDVLPPQTFIQGFIKNYSKFLGLDQQRLLALFRREFADQRHPPRILDVWKEPLDKKKFRLTPTKVLSAVVVSLVVIFFVYLWFEYRFFAGEPFLDIQSPQDQITLDIDTVKVSGKTYPEAKVMINNQEIQVDIAGNFTEEIKLAEGSNVITISASSRGGQTAKVERTVFFKR